MGGVAEHYNLPWHLLKESGTLQDMGVDMEWRDCPGGTGEMTRLLASSELDLAVLLTEGMVADRLKGSKAEILKVYVRSSLEWGVHIPEDTEFELSEKEQITFAVSRFGSGSHHMALLYAHQRKISISKLKFKEVGSLEGAMIAFKNRQVDAFLWERFTTEPYCNEHNLKRIDIIHTPWPCFVIAIRPDYFQKNQQKVNAVLKEVFNQASDLKKNPQAVELIASRYQLSIERAAQWFENVEWGKGENLSDKDIETVIGNLKQSGSLPKEIERFENKEQSHSTLSAV